MFFADGVWRRDVQSACGQRRREGSGEVATARGPQALGRVRLHSKQTGRRGKRISEQETMQTWWSIMFSGNFGEQVEVEFDEWVTAEGAPAFDIDVGSSCQ